MGFGSILKDILAEKNMSIKELSEATGIPLNTLYSITKRDTVNVKQETIEKISLALNVPSDDLVNMLRREVFETQKQLEILQLRLREAERMKQHEIEMRKKLADCLNDLTHYKFNDEEIGIIISTAILLKEPSGVE